MSTITNLLLLDFGINFNFTFNFNIYFITTFAGVGLFAFFLTHPAKFEKLVALVYKYLLVFTSRVDKTYVKYDIQGKVNSYLAIIKKKVTHIDIEKISIAWVDVENQTPEAFIKSNGLIIRLHKSNSQNKNIINASVAFISFAFLRKAKIYIAKYQRESLELFACYDFLKHEKADLLDQFVQDFLKEKLDNQKIAKLFEKFCDIDKAGIFYPVLVQELIFLGEKVFATNRNNAKIFEEVESLINYLNHYANRKRGEEIVSDFTGEFCKFSIRIIGRQPKVDKQLTNVYVNNLEKINATNETIYLIGKTENKKFMGSVYEMCKNRINYNLLTNHSYNAIIKDENGDDYNVSNYLMILRNNKIVAYHRN